MYNLNKCMRNLHALIDVLFRKDIISPEEKHSILTAGDESELYLEDQTIEYWKVEYTGIISEHKNMWTIYSGVLKLYLAILAAPVITAKLFIQTNLKTGAIKILPEFWLTLLGIGILGLVFTHTIIRYRLDIILYARWLNGLRKFLKESSTQIARCLEISTIPAMGPEKQRFLESPKRPIWFLVLFSGLANSYYIVAGLQKNYSFSIIDWLFVAVGIVIHFVLYICSCRGSQVAGISHSNS